MKKLGILVALAVVLGFVGMTQAAPLDLKQVSADAKWLVHVDVDAIRASAVVHKAIEKCKEMHKDAEQRMDKLKDVIGMDPRKDLHGVTLYGKQIGKHTGVLIVNAKVNQKLLLAKAEKATDHKVVKHGAYVIHTWTNKHRGQAKTAAGAFYKDAWVVFASSADELKAALDVLDGKASAAGAGSPVAGRVMPGTTVLMRVAGLTGAELPCKSPVAKQIDSARFAMGEHDGQSFFRAKAVMTNEAVVGQVKAIIEGGRAMATLHVGSDEQAKKLIDALKVTSEGKTLTLAWKASANDVWDVMQKCAKKMAEKRAKLGDKVWPHHPKAEKKTGPGQKPACEKKAPAEEEF